MQQPFLALISLLSSLSTDPARWDRDLSGTPKRHFRSPPPVLLAPDRIDAQAGTPGLIEVRFLRQVKAEWIPVRSLPLSNGAKTDDQGIASFQCARGREALTLEAALDGEAHFTVLSAQRGETYRVRMEAECGTRVAALFQEDSPAGQAIAIFQLVTGARAKLARETGLDFWKKKIAFVFPGNGDYYSRGKVTLTQGHHWDVVGHEMGHAIYDQAGIGAFGGGEHRIDECYSGALALSEGWATFFAGFVSLDPRDSDARFEYLVPRRAPIRIENVPGDVCRGPKNEWRVAAFFWDAMDLNPDGERSEVAFGKLFHALKGKGVRDAEDAARALERAGLDRGALSEAWKTSM